MARFSIDGGYPLRGEVRPSGNKNAAQPILAATLLTDQPVTISNLPDILDIRVVLELLEGIGARVERHDPHTVTVCAAGVNRTNLDTQAARSIRGSILFAGPLLARFGRTAVSMPGGCAIGRRGVGTHMRAFEAMGAEVKVNGGFEMTAKRLVGAEVLLEEASVTGTENAIMAASLAHGTTILRNTACEPHVEDLCLFLNSLGAHISGVGSNVLEIEGVRQLSGGECRIASDHTEVGSFIGLAAVTGGELRIRDAVPRQTQMTRLVLERLGVRTVVDGDDIIVPPDQELAVRPSDEANIPKIDDGVWPAFPSDMMSVALLVATQSRGTVLIWEKMFESRLFFVDRLIAMGASIILCDPHRAVVVGPSRLHGEVLQSPDIRAGVALLGAALCACGHSDIYNIVQIDRGYERIDEKLRSIGAHVERVEE